MPRIPDEEIARIKRETDLVALVRSRGVELAKHGTKSRQVCKVGNRDAFTLPATA